MSFKEYRSRLPNRTSRQVIFWWIGVRSLVRFLFWLLYRMRCFNRNLIPAGGPVVYVCNHLSHLDPMIVGCHVGAFAPLARQSLFDNPLLGWSLWGLGTIPLERESSDVGALRAAAGVLKAGGRVLIFPEGTRSRSGVMGLFRPGMLVLVRRSGATVVPLALEGVGDVWPPSRSRPRLTGRIAITTGTPISAEELLAGDREAVMERLRRQVETMRLELRQHMRSKTRGRHPAPGPGDRPYWEVEAPAGPTQPQASSHSPRSSAG